MKGFNITIRLKRRFLYFSFVILLTYYTLTRISLSENYNNNIKKTSKNSFFVNNNEENEEDPIIINDDEKFELDNKLINLLLNETVKLEKENNEIDSTIKKMILFSIQKSLKPEEFTELRKREEIHTTLWHSIFGENDLEDNTNDNINNNNNIDIIKYKNKLLEESSFLSQKHINVLSGNKKLLSIIHQSLYPWLYGFRYNSLSDIIRSSNGRGIVICTGNRHFKYARSTLDTLRHILNTKLPIEVFYNGEKDLSPKNRKIISEFENVYLSDITTYFDNSIVNITSWSIKPFSILASRFEEVILIDADALYLRDPIELFKEKGYQEKGTLFFRDRTLFPGRNSICDWLKSWMVDPLPETKELRFWNELSEHEMDSSTVVIHKTKTILGLLNVCKLNERQLRQEVVYRKVYGDKETYWMGFDMARQPYYMSKKPVAFVGEISTEKGSVDNTMEVKKICGHAGHTLENGKLMFWNGHIVKDKNIGIYRNEIIKFEAYVMEGEDNDWSINLACLLLVKNTKPIYFDEEEQKVYNKIMEKEREKHFIVPEKINKSHNKNRTTGK